MKLLTEVKHHLALVYSQAFWVVGVPLLQKTEYCRRRVPYFFYSFQTCLTTEVARRCFSTFALFLVTHYSYFDYRQEEVSLELPNDKDEKVVV